MTLNLRLEEFGGDQSQGASTLNKADEVKRLAFEEGYSSGWDDAMRTAKERGDSISAHLEDSVLQARLNLADAKTELEGQLADFLTLFLKKILSDTGDAIIAHKIRSAISASENPDSQGDRAVVSATPDTISKLSRLLREDHALTWRPDEQLLDDQVIIEAGVNAISFEPAKLIEALQDVLQENLIVQDNSQHD